jgi:hypothetical protein
MKQETSRCRLHQNFLRVLAPQPPWSLASDFFSFVIILQTVGLLGWVISQSQGLYLNRGQHKHRINTYTYQTPMPSVGFEHTNPASERAKTVHALDLAATATGLYQNTRYYIPEDRTLHIHVCEFLNFNRFHCHYTYSWCTSRSPATLLFTTCFNGKHLGSVTTEESGGMNRFLGIDFLVSIS